MIKDSALKQTLELLHSIRANKFKCSEIEEKQYNYEFLAIRNNIKNKILVYFGKKGVRKIIQGNSNTNEYAELNGLVTGNIELNFSKDDKVIDTEYIGTDETGKGDYFGPLVIAGFYINEGNSDFIAYLGVKDSKLLTDPQINNIAQQIISKYPTSYSSIVLEPEKYNELYNKFLNVNKLLNWGHSKVVENMLSNHSTSTVITDQFSKNPLEISKSKKYSNVNFHQMTQAEKYLGVAAASIIARYKMNMWFEKIENEGFRIKKGASANVEFAAKSILEKHGKQVLERLVKLHFKTTNKIFED